MNWKETEMIPYEPADLRGETLLVLAPHPDDEVIGCGGLVAIHAREQRTIVVAIVTDGVPGDDENREEIATRRRNESKAGLEILGAAQPRFLGFRDRQLELSKGDLVESLRQIIDEVSPDLILAPSPVELHPDHRAVAEALWEIAQEDETAATAHPLRRIAFYETSQALRPNALVDITSVAEAKFRAIRAHASQHVDRDYERYAAGLARYRTLTLPRNVEFAEAYWVVEEPRLRTLGWSVLQTEMGQGPVIERVDEILPITVVTRTRNRLNLLKEALESIRGGSYPAAMVVVNDGGESPRAVLDSLGGRIDLIEHSSSRGRSEAMNAGVRAARTPFVAFLDDDDLFYPEHLETLARAASSSGSRRAWYADAVSSFMVQGESGGWAIRDRLRIYSRSYDSGLLLIDNYIPLPTILTRRADYLDLGGCDPAFDLFEDWDFLIRLSRLGDFQRIHRLTCEIRHFEGSDSAILASPEGSAGFRRAKLQVWAKHEELLTPDLIAGVFERQKRSLLEEQNLLFEQRGRSAHLERDVMRLDREKRDILDRLQQEHERAAADTHQIGGRLLEAEAQLAESRRAIERAGALLQQAETALMAKSEELAAKDRDLGSKLAAIEEKDQALSALFAELERLNGILNTIYQSRTWKLHVLLEKLRGH